MSAVRQDSVRHLKEMRAMIQNSTDLVFFESRAGAGRLKKHHIDAGG